MNICFFSGQVLSDVIFKFIINKEINFKKCKNISICYFDVKLGNNTIVKFKAYDNLADLCFRNIRLGDFIIFEGRINSEFEVEVMYFEKLIKSKNKNLK